MIKRVMVMLCVLGAMALAADAETKKADLPALHKIAEITLSPTYSCRTEEDFKKGYGRTALFLHEPGRRMNVPDLLFNGACGSVDYFQPATAGDDMSLIADLGEGLELEKVSAIRAYRGADPGERSSFRENVDVKANHTYAVLINKREVRGLFVFTVTEHVPNKSVTLRYAVKSYVLSDDYVAADGFDWGRGNRP